MKRYFIYLLAAAALIVSISSCKKDNSLDLMRAEELRMLNEFVSNYYPGVEPKASGLYFIETLAGTGDSIKPGDQVKVWYTGRFLADSVIFDETSNYEPFTFVVGSSDIIQGMGEGVTYMSMGSKATLIIPSNLAYGASNDYNLNIPRFSTLIFDVEIYKHDKLQDQ